ncbi:helix-turn-helix domain-containing protein [Vreelandella titanicae]|uniref:helix-turn-helix domain-containing protein n=1 Tax=Vreelandella titanicae TaxID=664683 RepID=UPI003CFEB5ED|tara:strand:- start:838 stop:1161 length:324 start_codon:yes stop_codon:yes gene_type:complete
MANLLTAKDVAVKLSVSQRKAYALKSVIGYVQIEGNIRFEVEAVEAYIASCKRGPLPDQHSKWEARVGASAGSKSRKRVTAADIKALLDQKRKEKQESEHARTLRVD